MGLAAKGVNTNVGPKALRQMHPDTEREEPLSLPKWSSRVGRHTEDLAEALPIVSPRQAGSRGDGPASSSGLVVSFAE